jgi:hypothetical protein
MKKLIELFTGSKEQTKCLSAFLKMEFKEELVSIDMPHVGGYSAGSLTKVTTRQKMREACKKDWQFQS